MEWNKILYCLAGPTASGKTQLSLLLAEKLNAEIICVDSMTIYRHMNIGTAKVSAEEQKQIPHHLIDICEPWEEFSVQKFIDLCIDSIDKIWQKKKNVLLVVGTPLYFKSLFEGMFSGPEADWSLRKELEKQANEELYQKLQLHDPEAALKIALNDRKRIIRALEVFLITGQPISILQKELTKPKREFCYRFCCLDWKRELLYERIEQRVDLMLENGLIEETKYLLELPFPISKTAKKAIGYKDVIDMLNGQIQLSDLASTIKQNTRRYAKRQLTWWRKLKPLWIPVEPELPQQEIVNEILQKFK